MSIAIGFALSLACFALIGVASSVRATDDVDDYLLAGRSVNPLLAGLSSVATNNSGFMFVGILGYAYRSGVEVVGFQIAWILGDLGSWMWFQRRLRQRAGASNARSLAELVAADGETARSRPVAIVAGLTTFVLLTIYAAAQLKAGSVALVSLLDWPESYGIVLGAGLVALYSFSGGVRASIWTDAAQAFVMLIAMAMLLATAITEVGWPSELVAQLRAIDPDLVRPWPDSPRFGVALYLAGFVLGGAVTAAQPHVAIRTMAVESVDAVRRMRTVYFAWFIPFSVITVLVGLYARVLLPELASSASDHAMTGVTLSELALPELASRLLPGAAIGVVLAGLFAATMSTADSQVLACSATVTEDLFPKTGATRARSKAATLGICVISLAIALYATQSVFSLVLVAWSVLGAVFAPVLILRFAGLVIPPWGRVAAMGAGIAGVVGWRALGFGASVYEVLPGVVLGFLVGGASALVGRAADPDASPGDK